MKKNNALKLRLTKEEKNQLLRLTEEANKSTMSSYVREKIFDSSEFDTLLSVDRKLNLILKRIGEKDDEELL